MGVVDKGKKKKFQEKEPRRSDEHFHQHLCVAPLWVGECDSVEP